MEQMRVQPEHKATAIPTASPVMLPRPASFWTVLTATVTVCSTEVEDPSLTMERIEFTTDDKRPMMSTT
jgi:hypothetical protein